MINDVINKTPSGECSKYQELGERVSDKTRRMTG